MEIEGIDHVAIAVDDVERSIAWYVDVLGFERQHQGRWNGIPAFIGKGTTAIAIFPSRPRDLRTKAQVRAGQPDILHLAFRADRKNFLAAQEELKARGIKFEFEDHEISHSIYFRDPDNYRLEITTYELD
jgi:catechol 2,3-dioxygenase-like lactoylglutathione lyase family enzyme